MPEWFRGQSHKDCWLAALTGTSPRWFESNSTWLREKRERCPMSIAWSTAPIPLAPRNLYSECSTFLRVCVSCLDVSLVFCNCVFCFACCVFIFFPFWPYMCSLMYGFSVWLSSPWMCVWCLMCHGTFVDVFIYRIGILFVLVLYREYIYYYFIYNTFI